MRETREHNRLVANLLRIASRPGGMQRICDQLREDMFKPCPLWKRFQARRIPDANTRTD